MPAQNERGAAYSGSTWTGYIEGILERHIGKRIGPTMLRSIFVTHCERSGLSEADKESLAASMSHSRRAVSTTYCTTPLASTQPQAKTANRLVPQNQFVC